MEFKWQKQRLELYPNHLRVHDTIIIADLHLGKTSHFRKAGIPIPNAAKAADQMALMHLLRQAKPDRLIVLGDLFHSASNSECEDLSMITSQFPEVEFELVLGNHDILEPAAYRSMDFSTCERMELGALLLTHEPLEQVPEGQLNLHGHLHPGIRLVGKGRQSTMVPCYFHSAQRMCLPAFGALTGLMRMKPKASDQVFGVFGDEVVRVH